MLGNSMENLTALLPFRSQNGLKILLLIDSKDGGYWTYDNYFKEYKRFLLGPMNRQKLLKFSSLEDAQKEAIKIMEQEYEMIFVETIFDNW